MAFFFGGNPRGKPLIVMGELMEALAYRTIAHHERRQQVRQRTIVISVTPSLVKLFPSALDSSMAEFGLGVPNIMFWSVCRAPEGLNPVRIQSCLVTLIIILFAM